eukprot:m.43853 g.43853  ORF g.43853 m.43853 type:complete len:304 (-) comp19507_c1_seq1:113-1024(-)
MNQHKMFFVIMFGISVLCSSVVSFRPIQNPIIVQAQGARTGQKVSSIPEPSYTLALGNTVFVSSFWKNQVAIITDGVDIHVFAAGHGLDGPWGLAYFDGVLFVSSFGTDQIHRYDVDKGEFLGAFGNELELDCPEGLAVDTNGTLYVVSFLRDEVVKYSSDGTFLGVAAKGHLRGAEDVAVFGEHILVTSYYTDSINRYDPRDGSFLETFATTSKPVGLTVGFDHMVYVASYGTDSIVGFDPVSGNFIDIFASGTNLLGPSSLSFGTPRVLYVSSYNNNRIVMFNSTSNMAVSFPRQRRYINE